MAVTVWMATIGGRGEPLRSLFGTEAEARALVSMFSTFLQGRPGGMPKGFLFEVEQVSIFGVNNINFSTARAVFNDWVQNVDAARLPENIETAVWQDDHPVVSLSGKRVFTPAQSTAILAARASRKASKSLTQEERDAARSIGANVSAFLVDPGP